MMFRELANCPFKAHPASTDPSLCDSKTKECGKASKGIDKEFLIKKKKQKQNSKRQTLWFPRCSFCSTSVNRKYTLYRVIASFFCKTLNLAPREAGKVSLIFWDGAYSMETFPLRAALIFWDGLHSVCGMSFSQGSSSFLRQSTPYQMPFSQCLSRLLRCSTLCGMLSLKASLAFCEFTLDGMCFSHGLLAFWDGPHSACRMCISLNKLSQFKRERESQVLPPKSSNGLIQL